MRVLSLFDGMACGYEALLRAWIKIDEYYASEIDEHAIKIAKKNHPDIIEVWDVQNLWYDGWLLKSSECRSPKNIRVAGVWPIDLLIGWSPCQWFSTAWKMLNFDDPRSKLFFEYVRLLKEIKPKYFLLENVKMKSEFRDKISELIWCEPIEIDSALVSGQRRKRYYWTNIPWITQPQDKGIMLKDILETNPDSKYNLTEKGMKMLTRNFGSKWKALNFEPSVLFKITYPSVCEQQEWLDRKCPTLTASMGTWWWNVPALIQVVDGEVRIRQATKQWYIVAEEWDGVDLNYPTSQTRRWRVIKWKSNTLTTQWDAHVYNKVIRKLTPTECERLQTLPDGYTEWVSDTQRYKMLGNWWTVDVIAHIFSFIPKDTNEEN